MSYNAKDLAMRDPALAALVGAVDGADFGDSQVAGESDFGWDAPGADYYGYNPIGADGFFGAEGFFGYNIGADAPAAGAPSPTEALQLWKKMQVQHAHTSRRASLLNPNEHSTKKVERYSLSLKQDLVVGTPTNFNLTKAPDTELRAQRIVTNSPSPGFVLITDIKVANVSVTQGDDTDSYQLNPNSWGMQYDIPTLSPANRVTVLGASSSAVPSGFNTSDSFPFIITFLGPASMAG